MNILNIENLEGCSPCDRARIIGFSFYHKPHKHLDYSNAQTDSNNQQRQPFAHLFFHYISFACERSSGFVKNQELRVLLFLSSDCLQTTITVNHGFKWQDRPFVCMNWLAACLELLKKLCDFLRSPVKGDDGDKNVQHYGNYLTNNQSTMYK